MKTDSGSPLAVEAARTSVDEWMRATFPDRVVRDSRNAVSASARRPWNWLGRSA